MAAKRTYTIEIHHNKCGPRADAQVAVMLETLRAGIEALAPLSNAVLKPTRILDMTVVKVDAETLDTQSYI